MKGSEGNKISVRPLTAGKGGCMKHLIVGIFLAFSFCSSLFAGVCTRADLQKAVDGYIAAQKEGNPALAPLAENATYIENFLVSSIDESILQLALPIALSRSFLDSEACKIYTEVVAADMELPHVLGVRLTLQGDKISEINAIVTKEGDWKFDAEAHLAASSKEDWGILPKDQQVGRQTLIDAANAYLDMFTFEDIKVPWGIPCAHLEGGNYTGDGPRSSCKTGIPIEGIEVTERSFVVDVDAGVVNVFCRFGVTESTRFGKTDGLPDSHTFRLVKGKLRYIHSLSAVD